MRQNPNHQSYHIKRKIPNLPWKEGSLRALEAMSLAATLPQLPLPTTVTLDFETSLHSPLPCRDFSRAGDIAAEREEKREEEEGREGECEKEKIEKKNDRRRMEDGDLKGDTLTLREREKACTCK